MLDLYGETKQNKMDNDDTAYDASDVGSRQPLRMAESLSTGCDMSNLGDEHIPMRSYPVESRVVPKRFAFAAQKVSKTDMPSVRKSMESDDRHEWESAIRLELKE